MRTLSQLLERNSGNNNSDGPLLPRQSAAAKGDGAPRRRELRGHSFRNLNLLLPQRAAHPAAHLKSAAVHHETPAPVQIVADRQENDGDPDEIPVVPQSPAKELLEDLLSYLSPIDSSRPGSAANRSPPSSADPTPLAVALNEETVVDELSRPPTNEDNIAVLPPAQEQALVDHILRLKLKHAAPKNLKLPTGSHNHEADPSALSTNTTSVPGYTLERVLGTGAFGKVFLARHQPTNLPVAIKRLQKDAIDSNVHSITRVLREILVHKQFRHTHICRLLEVVDQQDAICMVLEYCPGGELLERIRAKEDQGGLAEEEARRIFAQVLSAIHACHEHQVVHRDVKPENILLDAEGNAKLIDFGFTNVYQLDQLLRSFCGSPAYAAPEMLAQKPYQGPLVDVWALGVTLFTMVCGRQPFDDPKVSRMVSKIVTGQYQVPVKVSAPLRNLLERMLKVNPEERISVAEILQHPWVRAAGNGLQMQQHKVAEKEPWDDAVISRVIQVLQLPEYEVLSRLAEEEPSHVYATYFLLLRQQQQGVGEKRTKESVPLYSPMEDAFHQLPRRLPEELQQDFVGASHGGSSKRATVMVSQRDEKLIGSVLQQSLAPGAKPVPSPPTAAASQAIPAFTHSSDSHRQELHVQSRDVLKRFAQQPSVEQ